MNSNRRNFPRDITDSDILPTYRKDGPLNQFTTIAIILIFVLFLFHWMNMFGSKLQPMRETIFILIILKNCNEDVYN